MPRSDGEPLPKDQATDHVSVPLYCTVGPSLCRVRVLTDDQWNALPEDHKPLKAESVPGLGWVVAFPEQNFN
jgi:hypothetical protein